MATETMDIAQVAVLIVGYNNADDVAHCLAALSKLPQFRTSMFSSARTAGGRRMIG